MVFFFTKCCFRRCIPRKRLNLKLIFVFLKFTVSWNTPALPTNLNSFMADMSLKPEVEATLIGDVASTFKESHDFMITELRNLLKDKIRMVTK